jgi:hypothetical protein
MSRGRKPRCPPAPEVAVGHQEHMPSKKLVSLPEGNSMSSDVQEKAGAPAGQDPATYALKMAAQLRANVETEAETRTVQRKRKTTGAARREADGTFVLPDGRKVVPRAVFPDAVDVDFTDMRLEDGSDPVRPGWCTRWVRIQNPDLQPDMSRVNKYQRYGYEVIRDKDGQPLSRMNCWAMQGPPESLAAIILKHQGIAVANPHYAEEELNAVAEDTNRQAGREVVISFADSSHRIERRAVAGVPGDE